MKGKKSITGITLEMTGKDGNAFAIIGRARMALRENGRTDLIKQFTDECTSGDYNNLLQTCVKYFDCV